VHTWVRKAMRALSFALTAALLGQGAGCSGDKKALSAGSGTGSAAGSGTGSAAGSGTGSGSTPAASVGAHALAFQRVDGGRTTLSTPAMATPASGSTMVVGVGRGILSASSLPTDNKGNAPYVQLGSGHEYTMWPGSGTALYASAGARGGDGQVVSTTMPASDEITLAAVEVAGTTIQDFKWNEVLVGHPLTSLKVTTTGPATLVAFWWGDAGVSGNKTAVPDGGFQVIDSVLASGALVQCAVAVKEVSAAGSYDVTWTSTPAQGAQLWLVAVE